MSWPPSNYRPEYGSGYQLSFEDFRQLVSYATYQASVAALLRNWFGYEIVGEGDSTVVRTPSDDVVDLRALHDLIQSDPEKQYRIYQCAMTLWR